MDTQPPVPSEIEYETYQIGVAAFVKDLLDRIGLVEAIDSALDHQPDLGASYGTLAQVVILNRLSFDPQPLYALSAWAQQHGIDQLLGIEAGWLDDDRLGALLENLAKHAAQIWLTVLVRALTHFGVVLEWLQADTTTIYFEGKYEDAQGQPRQAADAPCLVPGYNKDGHPQNVQAILSLIATQRVPLYYHLWDGNQDDDHIYVPDWKGLRDSGLELGNTVLIFDRKGCNMATLLALCQSHQAFLGAYPWTAVAKQTWQQVWADLQGGKRSWSEVDYVARNAQGTAPEARPQYKVCEVEHILHDEETGNTYPLRWIFSWNSPKAESDARQRQEALARGEQALQRVAHLLGKYDYTQRARILQRIESGLKAVREFIHYELSGNEEHQDWQLTWTLDAQAIAAAACFDGIALVCSNVAASRLSAGEVFLKYKQQVSIEQTFDFIKSPIQIRPMWLHCPQRLAGLTFLIMLAVLIASLMEYRVRQAIAQTQQPLHGLMPENRDTLFPTAEKLLKAFQDYCFVITRLADGSHQVHFPKPRPIQKQILDILGLLPPTPF